MRRVYVASPYRAETPAGVAANVCLALAACRLVVAEGGAPFAPHLVLPRVLEDADPAGREHGLACALAWLAAADEVLAVGEPTEGMRVEIAAARAAGVPVRRVGADEVRRFPAAFGSEVGA